MNNDFCDDINNCKNEIKLFLNHISNVDFSKIELQDYDKDFFAFVSKHILFFKYLGLYHQDDKYFKILISDFYYYIISILKSELRYMYLNERSILENYTRMITRISLDDDHVTERSFNNLKLSSDKFGFDISNYSLLKSEYATSCGYVHGGKELTHALSYVFDDCINSTTRLTKRANYYQRMIRVIKYLDSLLICSHPEFINGCFHRQKALLSYLLGKPSVDLLFNSMNKKNR